MLPVLPVPISAAQPRNGRIRDLRSFGEQTLELWHLLSLDAPSVVIAWSLTVAATRHATVSAAWLLVTFGGVWLVYVADRMLDVRAERRGSATGPLEHRHLFCGRHRRVLLLVGGAVLGLLLCLLGTVARALVSRGALLAGALAAWFGLIHLAPMPLRRRLSKEVAAGVFFTATVFAPEAGLGLLDRSLLLPALLFAALCTLNGAFISAWEHRHDGHAAPHLGPLACLLAAAALLLGAWDERVWPLAVPLALSAALLALLDRGARRLRRTTLRAAADLVLLTPLLLLPLLASPPVWHWR